MENDKKELPVPNALSSATVEELLAELATRENVLRISVGEPYGGYSMQTRFERCGTRDVICRDVLLVRPEYQLRR